MRECGVNRGDGDRERDRWMERIRVADSNRVG